MKNKKATTKKKTELSEDRHGRALKAIGAEVRAARLRARLTQVELAAKLDVEHVRISELELGKRNITICALLDVAQALGCKVTVFVGEVHKTKE